MKRSYTLAHCWTEPELGCAATVVSLTTEEADTLYRIVKIINEHGDGGMYLPLWDWEDIDGVSGGLSYQEALKYLFVNSRYQDDETCKPGEHYNTIIPEFTNLGL